MAVYQIVQSHGKVFDWLRDHKTDILTYGGIGLMTASTVAACVGTKKLVEEKDKIDEEPDIVKRVWNRSKHFVLATGFWASGVYCIHTSHGILKTENAMLSNTIATMAAGTLAYRNRWKDKVGNDEEEKVFFDEKTEEYIDENGKKKKVKTCSIYRSICVDVYFDQWSSWRADDNGDIELDGRTIDNVQAQLNNELRGGPNRFVYLQHAYDMLGLYTINEFGQKVDYNTPAGQNGGWIYDKQHPNGDNTIVLKRTKTYRKLDDGRVVPTWRISPNIDGNIIKPLRERGWIQDEMITEKRLIR